MFHKASIKEKLLKGGAWAFSGKVATVLAGLGINVLLTRLLTPEEMGAYFLIFSLVSVAAIVAQLGLTQAVVRLVAESMGNGQQSRARQSVVLVLRIVSFSGLVVACLLAFGVGQWISEQLFKSIIISNVMGLAAIWVVIMTFQSLMAEIYRGFHDIRLATVFGGLSTGVISMVIFCALWLMYGQSNLGQIVVLTLGAGLSSVLLSSVFLWDKLKKLPLEKNNISLIEVLKISWPMWVTSLVLLLLLQIDLWILGVFSSSEEVAVYGVASRVVSLVTMPLLIVNAVVPPLIAEMYAQGEIKKLEKTLRMVATLTGIPSLIILLLFMFFGEGILGLFFGEYYKMGGTVLVILSVGQLANVWAGSCGMTLMFTDHQSTMMVITMSCGMITALLAWLLVSTFGGVGVAIAATSGIVTQNVLMLLFAKNKVGVWTHVSPSLLREVKSFQ